MMTSSFACAWPMMTSSALPDFESKDLGPGRYSEQPTTRNEGYSFCNASNRTWSGQSLFLFGVSYLHAKTTQLSGSSVFCLLTGLPVASPQPRFVEVASFAWTGLETTLRGLSSEFVRSFPSALPQEALGGGASPIRTSLALVLAVPPNWLQLSFGLLEPPRAAPQDALRGAAAPGEAVGAGDGAPQDALGFGAGGFGGAGAGALGAGAAGAVGAGASTFFSFRRMNAACFTIFCAPNPSGGRTLGTGASRLNLAVQPAGPTPAARKVRALGTELLLPPYLPPGCNELSCGLDHAV